MKHISSEGIQFIKKFEGFRADAYKCPAGIWTIGYGHTDGVREGDRVDEMEAEALLRDDCRNWETIVNNAPRSDTFTQQQFDGLVSFCYNCGGRAIRTGSLGRAMRKTDDVEVWCKEIMRWCHANGKVLQGLQWRRFCECELLRNKGY